MKLPRWHFSIDLFAETARAVGLIAGLTAVMWLIGRDALGEAIIAMVYLLAVGWTTSRAGQGPGLSAALTAALMFDFFFIPPFLTFTVGSLESWLLLVIFVLVAVILVNRIQAGLERQQAREHEARLLYELSMELVGRQSLADLGRALAERLQQVLQAAQVQVTFFPEDNSPAISANAPAPAAPARKPDQVVPILSGRHISGEISLWHGEIATPTSAERLLQALAAQITLALPRMAPTTPTSR